MGDEQEKRKRTEVEGRVGLSQGAEKMVKKCARKDSINTSGS